MSVHLKKLGLSDTKFELKYHTPKCSQGREHPSNKKPHQRPTPQEQPSILSVLVDLLSRKQRESCPLLDHDKNLTKFVCLDENCTNRTGCSYCFLDGHQGHPKVESRTCLKDLQELQVKTQTSRELLRSELLIQKHELLAKLEGEVGSIREEFMANLEYISRKIRESIEARFAYSANSLINAHKEPFLSQADPQTLRDSPSLHGEDDLISSFMLTTTKHAQSKPSFRSITQYPLRREPFPPPRVTLSREEEQSLLMKLSRLNLTYVEEYLKHETAHLREVMGGFRIYEEFYTQLSSSLGEFFAAFKRALPSLKPTDIGLQQPDILQLFVHGGG